MDAVQAYEDRVSRMSRRQVEATLKSHDSLIGTERWSALDEALRTDLLAMGEILRKAME